MLFPQTQKLVFKLSGLSTLLAIMLIFPFVITLFACLKMLLYIHSDSYYPDCVAAVGVYLASKAGIRLMNQS